MTSKRKRTAAWRRDRRKAKATDWRREGRGRPKRHAHGP